MASDFLVATTQERLPILQDQIIQDNVLLRRLKEAGRIKFGMGGDGFEFRARKSSAGIVKAVGDNSVAQARTTNVFQKITGNYVAYAAPLMISRLQRKRNEGGSQFAKLFALWEEQLNEFYQDFEDRLGSDLTDDGNGETGDESTALDGLDEIMGTANTYLSIDRSASANSWWRSHTRAVPNDALDDDDADGVTNIMQYLFLAHQDGCVAQVKEKGIERTLASKKNKPDLIYCGATSFNNIRLSLLPQWQYTGKQADPGAELMFMGAPIEWDGYAVADKIKILTLSMLTLLVVGSTLIYVDYEGDLGPSGSPRAHAIDLVSQVQFFSHRPNALAELTNTD